MLTDKECLTICYYTSMYEWYIFSWRDIKVEAKAFDFRIKNGVLQKYNGDSYKVIIPKSVTGIGNNASENKDITEE